MSHRFQAALYPSLKEFSEKYVVLFTDLKTIFSLYLFKSKAEDNTCF